MADIKTGEPFGLDQAVLKNIDWALALKRIRQDLRSDFIYAPHLSFLYQKAGQELIASLKSELSSGTYSPGIPITVEVPKPFRIRVAVQSKRLGPNYSRPGSILLPRDRLLYQALADQAAPIVHAKTDHHGRSAICSRRRIAPVCFSPPVHAGTSFKKRSPNTQSLNP
jgi:hypothetical protein